MKGYKVHYENGDAIPCDSCDSEGFPTSEFDWGPPFSAAHSRAKKHLCVFCACTGLAYAIERGPTQDLARCMAQAFNILFWSKK